MVDIRKFGHDIRDFLQQVTSSSYLILAVTEEPQQIKEAAEALLERSRTANVNFNTQLSELIPMKTPPLNVMVVEDDTVNQHFLVATLRQQGHKVVALASSGTEMVTKASQDGIDLIVFDIHLPGCDGLCALQRIMMTGKSIPAVAVTGDKDMELVDRAMEAHVLSYLIKPVEPLQLLSAVQVAYARHREFMSVLEEKDTLEANMERKQIVDRAKMLLMRRNRWSEDQAFRAIQKYSMDHRVPMIDVARMVLEGRNI